MLELLWCAIEVGVHDSHIGVIRTVLVPVVVVLLGGRVEIWVLNADVNVVGMIVLVVLLGGRVQVGVLNSDIVGIAAVLIEGGRLAVVEVISLLDGVVSSYVGVVLLLLENVVKPLILIVGALRSLITDVAGV